MIALLLLAASTTSSFPQNSAVVEVCLSPGCLADGASSTLSKLKALSHPSICVKSGTCQSLCGKGPILIQNPDGDGSKKRGHKVLLKFMKDDKKLLPFLEGLMEENANTNAIIDTELDERDLNRIPDALIEGYNLVDEGMTLCKQKSYKEASQILKAGIDKAIQPAKSFGGDMEWMVHAHRSLAESLMGMAQAQPRTQNPNSEEIDSSNYDRAMESLQTALNLNPEDESSCALLAELHQARNDPDSEYRALVTMFALPDIDSPNPPRDVENQRRSLGFRLQELQRERE